MSDCKTYDGVTADVFACVKKASAAEHGTVYDPADGTKGTATTKTPVGTVVLSFDLDTAKDAITYCIEKKPMLAPASAIWDGIASSIDKCKG